TIDPLFFEREERLNQKLRGKHGEVGTKFERRSGQAVDSAVCLIAALFRTRHSKQTLGCHVTCRAGSLCLVANRANSMAKVYPAYSICSNIGGCQRLDGFRAKDSRWRAWGRVGADLAATPRDRAAGHLVLPAEFCMPA